MFYLLQNDSRNHWQRDGLVICGIFTRLAVPHSKIFEHGFDSSRELQFQMVVKTNIEVHKQIHNSHLYDIQIDFEDFSIVALKADFLLRHDFGSIREKTIEKRDPRYISE